MDTEMLETADRTTRIHTDAGGRESVLTRVFDAPRETVFKAWTNSALVAQWWGPHGFTNPVCEIDLRVGGKWRVVMRSPEGEEYPIKGVFGEIVAPASLVMLENWEEHPAEWVDAVNKFLPEGETMTSTEAHNTVTFEIRDGRTLLTVRTRFESAAVCKAMIKLGMVDGWGQSFERLDKLLLTL